MKYHEILKALIGIPSLSARLDNPFPLVGDKLPYQVQANG